MISNFLLCRFFVFANPEAVFGPKRSTEVLGNDASLASASQPVE
jgi:hypothetical protein